MVMAVGVLGAGLVKQVEVCVGEIEMNAAHRGGERGTAGTVFGVDAVIFTAAVVKEREEPDDRHNGSAPGGEDESVAFDPPPVVRAVNGMRGKVSGQGENDLPEGLIVDGVDVHEVDFIADRFPDFNPARMNCVIVAGAP